MQPNRDDSADNWQQPNQQPSQAPYAVSASANEPAPQPVVTLSPEEPAAPSQPTPETPEPSSVKQSATSAQDEPVHWQAHEYIHHEKNTGWFIVFGLVVAVFMAIAIFLMQSITFAILVPVMAIALIVYTRRPPRLLDYTLSSKGLYINDQLYAFNQFKSFGVIHDGDEYSIMLIPLKRFHPGVSVYFPEESGEAIVDMLGARLPMQELHLDMIDRLIRKLRI